MLRLIFSLVLPICALASVTSVERQFEVDLFKGINIDLPSSGLLKDEPLLKPFDAFSFNWPAMRFVRKPGQDVFKSISRDDFCKDIDVVQSLMHLQYGGWDFADKRGWNWQTFFSNWKSEIRCGELQGEIDYEVALKPYLKLKEFQPDNHTGPVIPQSNPLFRKYTNLSKNYLLNRIPFGDCRAVVADDGRKFSLVTTDLATQPKKTYVIDSTKQGLLRRFTLSAPDSFGNLSEIVCDGKTIGLEPIWQPMDALGLTERRAQISEITGLSGDHPYVKKISSDTVYLRFPTFSGQLCTESHELQIPENMGNEKLLIVDLRLNGGGSMDCAFPALSHWVPIEKVDFAHIVKKNLRSSCAGPVMALNTLKATLVNLTDEEIKQNLPAITSKARSLVDSILVNVAGNCQESVQNWSSNTNYLKRTAEDFFTSQRKVIVLIDNFCGSDCEALTYVLATQFNALVVGTNSGGVAGFIMPNATVLPHTGISFRLAFGTSDLYGDGRSVDGYGLDPDIILTSKQQFSRDFLLELADWLKTQTSLPTN